MVLDSLQLLREVDPVQDQDLGLPIHSGMAPLLELDQRVERQLEANAIQGAAPLSLLKPPVDVEVQTEAHKENADRPILADDDHDGEADDGTQEAGKHVPTPPALSRHACGTETWRAHPGQHKAGEVHKGVSHQEAHGQQWCDCIHLPDEHEECPKDVSAEEGSYRLAVLRERGNAVEDAQDLVPGDVLKQSRRHDETLECLAQ
mmetsp:Transcript_35221/g.82125  ORF Transcript_35221/g.82125 Transcript_35221/m.82125 type:complete len:204 (+) Transcript_35221:1396-2007(+)